MRILAILVLLAVSAADLSAQLKSTVATDNSPRWSFAVAMGPTPTASGNATTLWRGKAIQGSLALRRRVESSRLWLGVDVALWSAAANPAGIDSLAARGGPAVRYTESGAVFVHSAFTLSSRYDFVSAGPILGYGLANIGFNHSGGRVEGMCIGWGPCQIPAVDVKGPSGLALATGIGLQARLRNLEGWARLVPGL